MKKGDLIQEKRCPPGPHTAPRKPRNSEHLRCGVIIEMNINMWGEETVPSGILVLWSDENDLSSVWADEVELITEIQPNGEN